MNRLPRASNLLTVPSLPVCLSLIHTLIHPPHQEQPHRVRANESNREEHPGNALFGSASQLTTFILQKMVLNRFLMFKSISFVLIYLSERQSNRYTGQVGGSVGEGMGGRGGFYLLVHSPKSL